MCQISAHHLIYQRFLQTTPNQPHPHVSYFVLKLKKHIGVYQEVSLEGITDHTAAMLA